MSLTAVEILEKIIMEMNLSELAAAEKKANSATYDDALAQIQELLDEEQTIWSEVIYVPGSNGIVRVELERGPNDITARSVDVTPEGCPKEFVISSEVSV